MAHETITSQRVPSRGVGGSRHLETDPAGNRRTERGLSGPRREFTVIDEVAIRKQVQLHTGAVR